MTNETTSTQADHAPSDGREAANLDALIAEVDALPDTERCLLEHNTRVMIEFARRLVVPLREYREALAHPQTEGGRERVRHVKRGTEYEVVGEAEAQVAKGSLNVWPKGVDLMDEAAAVPGRIISDGCKLTVTRCLATGKLWVRFTDEFRDGRFETLAAAPTPTAEPRIESGDTAICIACNKPVRDGDAYYEDVNEGPMHAKCCGPEPESFTDPDGEPLKSGDPIPAPGIYRPEPRIESRGDALREAAQIVMNAFRHDCVSLDVHNPDDPAYNLGDRSAPLRLTTGMVENLRLALATPQAARPVGEDALDRIIEDVEREIGVKGTSGAYLEAFRRFAKFRDYLASKKANQPVGEDALADVVASVNALSDTHQEALFIAWVQNKTGVQIDLAALAPQPQEATGQGTGERGVAKVMEALWLDAEDEVARLAAGFWPTDEAIAEAFHEHRREYQGSLPPWPEVQEGSGIWRYSHNFATRLSSLRPTTPAPQATDAEAR